MPKRSTNQKRETKIPVRVLATENKAPKTDSVKQDKKVVANRKKTNLPPKKEPVDLQKQKKKLYISVFLITAVIATGWLIYFKNHLGETSVETKMIKGATDQFTEAFDQFSQTFTQIDNLSSNNQSEQRVEEFEKRLFPQFE